MRAVKSFWTWISSNPLRKLVVVFISLFLLFYLYIRITEQNYLTQHPWNALGIDFLCSLAFSLYGYWIDRKRRRQKIQKE